MTAFRMKPVFSGCLMAYLGRVRAMGATSVASQMGVYYRQQGVNFEANAAASRSTRTIASTRPHELQANADMLS